MASNVDALARRELAGGSIATTNLILDIVFPSLAILAVAARFYARRLKRISPGVDDWLVLVALVLHMAQMSMGILRMASIHRQPESNGLTIPQAMSRVVSEYLPAKRLLRKPRFSIKPPSPMMSSTLSS